ncbi:MAG: hypothetical protein KAX40_06965 [Herpetosiphon sp.]|nr:hypothetical protein [Herpetosiphon sp.]
MAVDLQQMIHNEVSVLSDDEMLQVLDFVASLRNKGQNLPIKSLSTIFEELSSEIPLDQWSDLPNDGAENHDHYLYGAPKRN